MDYVTVKCYAETRRLLRLIAAATGEQMMQVLDRLCREEWAKVDRNLPTNVAPNVADDQTPGATPTHRSQQDAEK